MADERNALKELVKSHIPGTDAHHQRSAGDPAYCAATATGKSKGPTSGEQQVQDVGGAAVPQQAGQQQAQTQQQMQQGEAPGAAGEMLKGLGMAPK